MISGNLSVANAAVILPPQDLYDAATVTVQTSGAWTGTLAFEGTIDGATWFAVLGFEVGLGTAGVRTITVNGNFRCDLSALQSFRVRMSVHTGGTATVVMQGSLAASAEADAAGSSAAIANIYGLYTLAQQAAFAATMAWWLDPTAPATNTGTTVGSPIPPSEYTKRTTGLTISGAGLCTVTITNPDPTEVLHFPIGIPAGVQLLLIGAGAVAVHAGTVTTWRSQVPATQTPCGITDTALPAANSWTTYLNKRGRITSGPRAGICFWVEKDEGAKTARVQQTYSIPVAFPFDDAPTLTNLVNTDPYVLETLPIIGGLDFSGWEDTDALDDAEGDFPHRIIIQDLHIAEPIADGADPNTVTRWKGGSGVSFVNCSTGTIAPYGNNMWFLGSRSLVCQMFNGGSLFAIGSAFDGELSLAQEPAFAQLDNCLLQGLHAFHIQAGSKVSIVGATAAFDSTNGGCDIAQPASTLTTSAAFYGSGNAATGITVITGSKLITPTLPNITGAAGNVTVDTSIMTWAATPYTNGMTGSSVTNAVAGQVAISGNLAVGYGTNPVAAAGDIRGHSAFTIKALRNAGGASDVSMIRVDGSDGIVLGDATNTVSITHNAKTGGFHAFQINSVEVGRFDGTQLLLSASQINFAAAATPAIAQAQSTTGVGAMSTWYGQQGKSGSVGGILRTGGGGGGVSGTQLAGATQIDLGALVSNASAKFSILAGAQASILDVSQTASNTVTFAATGVATVLAIGASSSIRLSTTGLFWTSGFGDVSIAFANVGTTGNNFLLQAQGGTTAGGQMTVRGGDGNTNGNGSKLVLGGGTKAGSGTSGTTEIQFGATVRFSCDGTGIGFFAHAPVAQQVSGGTTAGAIAGLVALGLFSS